MGFRIRETDTGLFEIIQSQPVVRGSFPDKDTAHKVMRFLVDDAMESEDAEKVPAFTVAFQKSQQTQPAASTTEKATAKSQPDTDITASVADWSGDQRAAAFARIDAGEKIFDIARSLGVSGYQLRACWASEVKRRRNGDDVANNTPTIALPAQSTKPVPGAAKIPPALMIGDQAECRLCGREFRQSGSMTDTCARCTKDIS